MQPVDRGPRLAVIVLAGATLLAGCTDRTVGGGGGVGSSDPGTTGPAGTATGSDTGDGCSAFDDAPLGEGRTVEIRNAEANDPIFLGTVTSCTTDRYRVAVASDPDAGHYPPAHCEPTCASMREGGCACPESCPVGFAIRLEPGGVYRTAWPSVLLVPDELSPDCVTDESCTGACPIRKAAPAGEYRAEAVFLVEPTACSPVGGDPTACACEPNEDGWCETSAPAEGEPYTVDTVFTHPQTDPISIEFVFLP
ncbi:MAG: hypothetical protein D6705_13800 [Deltaproteobacteria bacterium]|nr:MAG: hypothetical protein D6705_13800 [Deltaproteobacteria bacterium]